MTTTHETIMVALEAALQASGLAISRSAPLIDLTKAGEGYRLLDGTIEQVEVYLNPRSYDFTMTPVVQIVVAGGAANDVPNGTVDARIASLLAQLGADLGDMVTDVRPQPSNMAPKIVWGAPNVKAAEFGIEIDYFCDSSAG